MFSDRQGTLFKAREMVGGKNLCCLSSITARMMRCSSFPLRSVPGALHFPRLMCESGTPIWPRKPPSAHGHVTITSAPKIPHFFSLSTRCFDFADCLWENMGTGTCTACEWRMLSPGTCSLRRCSGVIAANSYAYPPEPGW